MSVGVSRKLNSSNQLLSDLVSYRTYSRALIDQNRKESFEETVERVRQMHLDRFPTLVDHTVKAFEFVSNKLVMPSMRALQYGGDAILKNNCRQYNCSYTPIDYTDAFGEILFLLLSGCGVGYSVQKRHISQLPKISAPREEGVFFIQDSIQGWAQAMQVLIDSYFYKNIKPIFNYSNIRAKGEWLFTTGSRAPGPEPLKKALEHVESKFQAAIGRRLTDIEVHDILCIISDCVVSGGVRRAAMISFFDKDSTEMLKCKSGNWSEKHPYRARANNSAVLVRDEITREEFNHIFDSCQSSNAGEPGIFWSNNADYAANPCVEASLYKNFCNLTSVNQTGVTDKSDFMRRVYWAAYLGTIQAAYTDFPYLNSFWKKNTEDEALLGVSFTGITDMLGVVDPSWLREAAELVLNVNEQFSGLIGTNLAARATVVKPEGSSSCVLGSSSGIHSRKGRYYLRRIQLNNGDTLLEYLKTVMPELIEPAFGVPDTSVITIPQESPDSALLESGESAIDAFNRAMLYNNTWIKYGHRSGPNKHNVSCTLSLKPEEWAPIKELMWANRADYTGMSMYPYDNGSYVQAPFEVCSKEKFDELNKLIKPIDVRSISLDGNPITEMAACAGGSCEITYL